MRVGEREHARFVLGDQLGQVARVARGLREQREQLREQIAGAVAQFADHQLVALVRLAALDRARDHVGDRAEERDVVLAEAAPPRRVRAEHAVGAAVASGDRHAHAAVDAVIEQQRGRLEARLGFQIEDDHRPAGGERVAAMRMAAGRLVRGADQPLAPAVAGAQQQLGIARHQLEDFHELDVEDLRDGRDHVVEQLLQIGLGERLLAEARDAFPAAWRGRAARAAASAGRSRRGRCRAGAPACRPRRR